MLDTSESTSRSIRPLRLVLMGTGPFAVPAFEALREAGHEMACVVTRPQPPIKSRRGPPPSPVRQWAESHQLTIDDPESINTETSIAKLRQLRPALLVVCDYGQILKSDVLEVAELGGINLHGSLLPKYRGAAPVQWAMLCGETVTGVSVIHMTPRLDGGPVVTTRSTPIGDQETAGELEARLSKIGVEATLQAVDLIAQWDGQTTLGKLQDPSQVTKAPRLQKADAQIDWSRSAREIDCHVRGMQPWPVAYTNLPMPDGKPPLRLAIKKIKILEDASESAATGEIVPAPNLVVATADRLVEIVRVQPAGKREMTGQDFLRGQRPPEGTRLA